MEEQEKSKNPLGTESVSGLMVKFAQQKLADIKYYL